MPPSVKLALTPGRPRRRTRRVVENDDYAAFVRRVVAAHGRRISSGDIEGLPALAGLAEDIDTAMHTAITGLRAVGWSWAEIAARLGTTRQAAHERYGGRRRSVDHREERS